MGKEMKSKDTNGAAQVKASKLIVTFNGVKRKSSSSETDSAKNDANGSSKKMKEGNLGSENIQIATRGTKRKVEETQGKPKSNASKSVNSESISRKEKKSEPKNRSSTSKASISKEELSLENNNAKSKKEKENGNKKLKIDSATSQDKGSSKKSVKDDKLEKATQRKSGKEKNTMEKNGNANKDKGSSKKSVKGDKISSEKAKNGKSDKEKKAMEKNGNANKDKGSSKKSVKNEKLSSQNAKQGKSDKQKNAVEKNGNANKKLKTSTSKQEGKPKANKPSSSTKKSVKPSQTQKEVSTSKHQEAAPSKSPISLPAEKSKEPSARRMKVMRSLGGDIAKGSAEIFFRKVKFWKEDGEEEAPPIFNVDGVNYFHVKVVGLLFVATTRPNVSPSFVLELVQRIARVIKDYLGFLNEEALRKNFVLVYELLDQLVGEVPAILDFGFVQTTSTEVLKSYIFNEPIVVDAARLPSLGPASMFMQRNKRMPGTAVTQSVVANEPGGRRREEIFVDIIEKISMTFSSSGYILTSEIDGTIQMKSYLSGNPEIRLALNDEVSIGRGGGRSAYDYGGSSGSGAVILDDCNFHESVHLDSFDVDRTLSLVPPDGEFPVMNYRMTQEFKAPFRINTLIEEAGSLRAEVILKVRAEFGSSITANTIVIQMPLPTYTSRVSFEMEPGAVGQSTDFKESNKRLEWSLKKIVGGSDHTLRAKLTFSQESHGNITKEAGPVSMTFIIPMYNASRLQVKYLQISKKAQTYNPYRVEYVHSGNQFLVAAYMMQKPN
ncbi:hypothetical protein Leryth_022021 [Lithospermum erythrorhizon]|nr:hypothetical protein Leryth_022021 [Lithospermum erythrorhizon]